MESSIDGMAILDDDSVTCAISVCDQQVCGGLLAPCNRTTACERDQKSHEHGRAAIRVEGVALLCPPPVNNIL